MVNFVWPYRDQHGQQEMEECKILALRMSAHDVKHLTIKYMQKDASIDWTAWKRDAHRILIEDIPLSDAVSITYSLSETTLDTCFAHFLHIWNRRIENLSRIYSELNV